MCLHIHKQGSEKKDVQLQDGYQWHQIVFEKLEIDLLNPWLPLEAESVR
jgi:hypothetical protein